MNKYFPILILVSSLGIFPVSPRVFAQSECYLQAPNGENIDLGHLCGSGTPPKTTTSPRTNASTYIIPIKRREMGIPVVEVIFNGSQKYEMLFDTGASGIAITESMANAIGVRKEQTGIASTAGGNILYHLGRVNSVQAGNLLKKNLEVGISPQLQEPGLLGQNFFGHYDVIIKQNVIELHPR